MDLVQCLSILTSASSDNEKMAAMLLVAKLIKSGDIGTEGRRKVFDAVGFNFLNRLLATKSVPEDCNDNPYHKIAITILACFCTDQDLALHPQVTSKIPLFNEFLLHSESSNASEESDSMTEDALQCLQGIAGSCSGLKHLMRSGHCTLQSLAKCYIQQSKVSEEAKDLLVYVVGQEVVKTMDSFQAQILNILAILSKEFNSNQDALKFKLCNLLHTILIVCGEALDIAVGCEWVGDIAHGLKDILSSKLDAVHRNPALHLSAILCQLFGLGWVAAAGSQFLILLVDLFSVETRLILDGRSLSEILLSSDLLCSCFIVIESTIVQMTRHATKTTTESFSLSEEDLLHLHSTLTESFTFILLLLNELKSSLSSHQENQSPPNSDLATDSELTDTQKTFSNLGPLGPLLIATIRVIGAWLAEDSLSLSAEVHSLLPFLVQLARGTDNSVAESKCEDLLKFLLPGMSHLTAEDKPRKILLEAGVLNVLLGHMQRLLAEHPNNIEVVAERLRLCCEVLVNVCVCEPTLVKDSEDLNPSAALFLKIFKEAPDACVVLKLNTLLLFIMMANKRGPVQISQLTGSLLRPTLNFILHYLIDCLDYCPDVRKAAVIGTEEQTADNGHTWEDVSELWFISMRELSLSVSLHSDIVHVAKEEDYVQLLTAVLANTKGLYKDNEHMESITTAICTFLQVVTQ